MFGDVLGELHVELDEEVAAVLRARGCDSRHPLGVHDLATPGLNNFGHLGVQRAPVERLDLSREALERLEQVDLELDD